LTCKIDTSCFPAEGQEGYYDWSLSLDAGELEKLAPNSIEEVAFSFLVGSKQWDVTLTTPVAGVYKTPEFRGRVALSFWVDVRFNPLNVQNLTGGCTALSSDYRLCPSWSGGGQLNFDRRSNIETVVLYGIKLRKPLDVKLLARPAQDVRPFQLHVTLFSGEIVRFLDATDEWSMAYVSKRLEAARTDETEDVFFQLVCDKQLMQGMLGDYAQLIQERDGARIMDVTAVASWKTKTYFYDSEDKGVYPPSHFWAGRQIGSTGKSLTAERVEIAPDWVIESRQQQDLRLRVEPLISRGGEPVENQEGFESDDAEAWKQLMEAEQDQEQEQEQEEAGDEEEEEVPEEESEEDAQEVPSVVEIAHDRPDRCPECNVTLDKDGGSCYADDGDENTNLYLYCAECSILFHYWENDYTCRYYD